jgi:hypothetical protein
LATLYIYNSLDFPDSIAIKYRAHSHFCRGKLHRADFDRKPRGGPQWARRYTFCCAPKKIAGDGEPRSRCVF